MSFQRPLALTAAALVFIIGSRLVAAEKQPEVAPNGQTEDPALAQARKLMAQAKFPEAKAALEVIVSEDKKVRGEQDSKTLSDRLELAIAQGKAGDSIEAEGEMRDLLDLFERRLGPDQDVTLNCRTALARLLVDVGRRHEAVAEYRKVLEIRERALGAEDIEVARVRHLLADALAASHQFDEAISQFQQAGVAFERLLGPDDPETLLNRSNLALAESEHGAYDPAEKDLKDVLAIRERVLGPKDISVFTTCFNLARVLGAAKRYEDALTYATRAADGLRGMATPSTVIIVQAERLCTEIRADLKRTQAPKDSTP